MLHHLLYHVTPLGNWEWNLAQLCRRAHVFDGQRVIAIAQGETADGKKLLSHHDVKRHLPGDCRIVLTENDPVLRETASLSSLLDKLAGSQQAREGITFYGHTKGTSRQSEPLKMREAIKLWTEVMYARNLDYMAEVEADLEKHSCTGCFKRYGRFGHFPKNSLWHYSGTFFWFRNKDLFARDWRNVPQQRYGAEAYLSTLFTAEEAGCVFGDGITDLYNVNYMKRILGIEDGSPRKRMPRTGASGANPRTKITG